MASIYKRGDVFWIAYYQDGQHVQESLRTQHEQIAKEKKKRIEYELAIGDLHRPSRLPLDRILQQFCEHLEVTRTFKSYKNDVSRLRVFFGPSCPALQPGRCSGPGAAQPAPDRYARAHVKVKLLEDVTPTLINQFIGARIRENGWAPKTANSLRQVLHRLFGFAIKHHAFRSRDRRFPNPADGVERLREPAPEIRFLTQEQIAAQLDALANAPLLRTMVATLIYAGLRREELLWLTPADVDLGKRLIRVQAKTIKGVFWQPKTKKNRVVPISTALRAILASYRPRARARWYFPTRGGGRWDPDNFSQRLRAANQAAGLVWGCLDFRHTFGSLLAQRGESLYKIATLMGNSPEICRRHYAALIPENMHDSVEFGPRDPDDPPDQTTTLLQEVLAELRANRPADTAALRVVRDDAS
jgi:integrase